MEFLRFGSSIPGSYWGCCACCIIQNFKVDPDEKASIELVSGDGGGTLGKFAGPTWRDIFEQRLRIGTFSSTDMPNHAFFAILTQWQITSEIGNKWLVILREHGFEFIRTVNNSVYSGASLANAPAASVNNNDNHIFGLFRNIGKNSLKDPFTPPKEWTSLPKVKTEQWDFTLGTGSTDFEGLTKVQFEEDKVVWAKPVKPLLTKQQVIDAGAPVILAGLRSRFPQQPEANRESTKAADKAVVKARIDAAVKAATTGVAAPNPSAAFVRS